MRLVCFAIVSIGYNSVLITSIATRSVVQPLLQQVFNFIAAYLLWATLVFILFTWCASRLDLLALWR